MLFISNSPAWAGAPPAVTLQEAIARALANAPQLKAAEASMLASKGERRQAGTLPNPHIGVEVENVAGQGAYRGTDSAEITYGVSQLVEIGGKRSARQNAADQEYKMATSGYESARLDLIRSVRVAYMEAVAAQEESRLAKEQKDLAADIVQSVSRRVIAAAAPSIHKSRAEVALASSSMNFERAKRAAEIAKKKLSVLWADIGGSYQLDDNDFFAIQPPVADPGNAGADTPDIARLEARIAQAKANLDLEQANAIPDPTVNLGVRDLRESDSRAFVASVSLPIPVFNLNRGNIEKARHEVGRSESEKQAALLERNGEIARIILELQTAYDQAQSLKTSILPIAEKAFSQARAGYQAGKFSYLEILDAQHTLFDVRGQYNAALKDYHARRADLDRLTGKHKMTETDWREE
ncbi:MAG: TolC family protein [Alphaproteobacteria bacterium]